LWGCLFVGILGLLSRPWAEGSSFLHWFDAKGFRPQGNVEIYDERNIFHYIDGEAEVYFGFGFRSLHSRVYRSAKSGALIRVDAYEMASPQAAAGVFGRYASPGGRRLKGLGEGAWTDGHVVLFHRGRFFVRIWSEASLEAVQDPTLGEMKEVAGLLDKALEGANLGDRGPLSGTSEP